MKAQTAAFLVSPFAIGSYMFQANRKSRLVDLSRYLWICTFFIGTYLTLFCSTNLAEEISVTSCGASFKIMDVSKPLHNKVETTVFHEIYYPKQPPRKTTLQYNLPESDFSFKVIDLEKGNNIVGSIVSGRTHFFCLLFNSSGLVQSSYSLVVAFLESYIDYNEVVFYSGTFNNSLGHLLEINASDGIIEFSMPSSWRVDYCASQIASTTVNSSLKQIGDLENKKIFHSGESDLFENAGLLVFQSKSSGNKCVTDIYLCHLPEGVCKESMGFDSGCNTVDLAAKSDPNTRKRNRFGSGINSERIRRPMNPFMLFSKDVRPFYSKQGIHNAKISKILGEKWRRMNEFEKEIYREKAAIVSAQHREMYPNYKYQPQKKIKKVEAPSKSKSKSKSKIIASSSNRVRDPSLRKRIRAKALEKGNTAASRFQYNISDNAGDLMPASSVENNKPKETFKPQLTEPCYSIDSPVSVSTYLDNSLDSSFSSTSTYTSLDELLEKIPLFDEHL